MLCRDRADSMFYSGWFATSHERVSLRHHSLESYDSRTVASLGVERELNKKREQQARGEEGVTSVLQNAVLYQKRNSERAGSAATSTCQVGESTRKVCWCSSRGSRRRLEFCYVYCALRLRHVGYTSVPCLHYLHLLRSQDTLRDRLRRTEEDVKDGGRCTVFGRRNFHRLPKASSRETICVQVASAIFLLHE